MVKQSTRRFEFSYFLLGLSNSISFHFIGLVIVAEIIICLLAIHKFLQVRSQMTNEEKRIIHFLFFFGALWFLTQFFTDIYLDATTSDTLKSLSQIFVLIFLLLFMFLHFQHNRIAFRSYLIGVSLSTMVIFLQSISSNKAGDWWKFYFGPSLSVLILLYLGHIRLRNEIKFILIFGLSLISFFLGSRSLGLILLFTAISFLDFFSTRGIGKSLCFLIALLLIGNFANSIFREASLSGRLGFAQQKKAQLQYQAGPIFLVARSEFLYQVASIKESPIFGSGSNPNLSANALITAFDLENKYGVITKKTSAYAELVKTGKTPQHSIFFGAWLEGGIFSIILLLYLFIMMIRWNFRNDVRTSSSNYSILSRYCFFNFCWAFFFSPLGAGSRMTFALGIGICYFAYKDSITVKKL